MKTSTKIFISVLVEQMKDERKISKQYKEETLLVSEDDIYAE